MIQLLPSAIYPISIVLMLEVGEMPEEKFLNQTYRLETQEETLAHYEAWAETYDEEITENDYAQPKSCLLYTSPSPRDRQKSRMPSSA